MPRPIFVRGDQVVYIGNDTRWNNRVGRIVCQGVWSTVYWVQYEVNESVPFDSSYLRLAQPTIMERIRRVAVPWGVFIHEISKQSQEAGLTAARLRQGTAGLRARW